MGRIDKSEEDRTRRRIAMIAGEGITASEIAEILDISPATVYRYRDKFDIHIKEGKKGRKSEKKNDGQRVEEKIAYLVRAGATLTDITIKLDLPPLVIKAIARKNGIPIVG